jgi:hypothetical protein
MHGTTLTFPLYSFKAVVGEDFTYALRLRIGVGGETAGNLTAY